MGRQELDLKYFGTKNMGKYVLGQGTIEAHRLLDTGIPIPA